MCDEAWVEQGLMVSDGGGPLNGTRHHEDRMMPDLQALFNVCEAFSPRRRSTSDDNENAQGCRIESNEPEGDQYEEAVLP